MAVLERILVGAGPHDLSRRSALALLQELESYGPPAVGSASYLEPDHRPEHGATWPPRGALAWGTGLVLLETRWGSLAIEPPLPLAPAPPEPGAGLDRLRLMLAGDRLIGLVFLRLGAFAVGVLDGERLVASKSGRRYVHGRHRAGGQSQRRFERNREKWVQELFDKLCRTCEATLGQHAAGLDHLLFGGDRHVLAQFRKRCDWLQRLDDRVLPRLVPVGRPGLATLERSARTVWSCRVFVRSSGETAPPA